MSHEPTFISIDWGTTHLRARLIDRDGYQTIAEFSSADGAVTLANQGYDQDRPWRYEKALQLALKHLGLEPMKQRLPIIISGMASSSIGWKELPYASLPLSLTGKELVSERIPLPNWSNDVWLISGVRDRHDVMRGEEIEALGALAWMERPNESFSGTLVFPGTHSKHIRIDQGTITGLKTHMTGEIFALMSEQSLLRHSCLQEDEALAEETTASFIEGIELGAAEPLSHALFQVRARSLLKQLRLSEGREFLSGVMIGAELRELPHDQPLVLTGEARLQARYVAGIQALAATSAQFSQVMALPAEVSGKLAVLGQYRWLKAMNII